MNFESIHNYYESLVIQRLLEVLSGDPRGGDEEFVQDAACVALNALPARYVRYDVDMAFFLTSDERATIDRDVDGAVQNAIERVEQHRRRRQEQGY